MGVQDCIRQFDLACDVHFSSDLPLFPDLVLALRLVSLVKDSDYVYGRKGRSLESILTPIVVGSRTLTPLRFLNDDLAA